MGSDSSCCGAHNGPIRPEVNASQLTNRLSISPPAPNTIEQHSSIDSINNNSNHNTIETKPTPPKQMQSTAPNNVKPTHQKHTQNHKKKRKKKTKYNKVSTQIEILCSENAKAQSLLLCSKPEKIHRDGTVKEFGFLKYLNTNLSDKAAAELFSKFPSKSNGGYGEHSLSVSQFVTLLTLVVIIYRVKLYQLRTATKEKPALNSEKIKTSVEHLAIWCIRKYGQKQNTKKDVKVYDDKGNEIKGRYYVYKFRLTQREFSKNIYKWLKRYVDNEGEYPL